MESPALPPNWELIKTNTEKAETLQKRLKITPFLCEILVQKGIHTYEEAKSFFNPEYENLHNPFLLNDMRKAVERIKNAIDKNETILIYGDYDSDGICATTILFHFLQKVPYPHIKYYIPDREQEGYGTSDKGIQYIIQQKKPLLITVDCGIRSKEHIKLLNRNNIDTIICDHHLPDKTAIPQAYAILNPKYNNPIYPFKELCGCGIVFKLLQALSNKYYPHINPLDFTDFTGLATVSDMVPITDENRILVHLGLKKLNENPHPTLQMLLTINEALPPFNTDILGFLLGPLINATGRMAHAHDALEFFLTTSTPSYKKAQTLTQNNKARKKIQAEQTEQMIRLITPEVENHNPSLLIAYQPRLKKGVIGLIAGTISEQFNKPTIILTSENETSEYVSGSGRSPNNFNITEALTHCAHHLSQYGGHNAAAGLSLLKKNIADFKKDIQNYHKNFPPETEQNKIQASVYLPVYAITEKHYKILQRMGPFGINNPEPSFFAANITTTRAIILKEKHLKLFIRNTEKEAIGFNMAEKYQHIDFSKPFALHYKIGKNNFKGKSSLQLSILHIAQDNN